MSLISTLDAAVRPAPAPRPAVEAPATGPTPIIDRGLAGLVALQASDGGFGDVASTALAGLALLAGGHTPTRGLYRDQSLRCLRRMLARQDKATGYLGDSGNMYAHGFATLYLAECYGEAVPEPGLRRAVEAAIDLIHRAQNNEGGWRYAPIPVDADVSVTICQVMALRAAYNAGITIVGDDASDRAQTVIGKAVAYVRSCANGDGSFGYMRGSGGGWGTQGADGIPRAAAGAMCLIGSGVTDPADRTLGPALGFVRKHFKAHFDARSGYFWYGQYYAAQAMYHSPDPTDWDRYWNTVWPAIAKEQQTDGTWNIDAHTQAYATAMALIILQIPNQYLPILQR